MPIKALRLRVEKAYKGIVEELFIQQRNNNPDLTVQELIIRAEILKRDFTKRQTNIVFFIFTFSYAYGKTEALIPKLMDFEVCGVSKTNIKRELDKLIEMNVINWKKEENLFEIKSPFEWSAPYHDNYNDDRSQALFFLNLKHAGIDIEPILAKLDKI